MPQITIDGVNYSFEEGESILDIAKKNNIDIPVMCYLEHITPTGACRLCLVEVEGYSKPMAACVTYAMDGMKVFTNTEEVKKQRNRMMEFILIKHPLDCPVCDKAGECMLQDTAYSFGIREESVKSQKPNKPIFDWNMIIHDANLCVLCERCVKVCHEITGNSALKIAERGFNNLIVPSKGETLNCDFCGICVDSCPVGALLDKPYKHSVRSWDLEKKESVCTICPVGCSVEFDVKDDEIYRGRSTKNSFVCSKGRYTYKYPDHPSRFLSPMENDNGLKEVEFDELVDKVSSSIKSIVNNYGSDAVGILLSGRLSTESIFAYKEFADRNGFRIFSELDFEDNGYYSLYRNKFNTLDTIGTIDDIKKSDLIFVVGSDIFSESLGIKWRVMNAVIHNNSKLVTIGLKKYEYDFFTDASFMADYGNFAKIFEDIKKSDEFVYQNVRNIIKNAKKVTFIVGNEYISAESQLESVFAFVDYIGKEKLHAYITTSDKTNVSSIFKAGLGLKRGELEKFLTDLEDGKVKFIISAGFYPYSTFGSYKRFIRGIKKVDLLAIDLYENEYTKFARYVVPVATPLEEEYSYITLDGRMIKTTPVISVRGKSVSDVAFISKLIGKMGGILPFGNREFFNAYVSGRNGIPAVSFDEIDGYLVINKENSYKQTDYSYREMQKGTKEVFVNAKYHNGIITTYAAVKCEDEECKRDYYFDVKTEVLSGPDACFNGSCSLNRNIAKGIVLIPKNR